MREIDHPHSGTTAVPMFTGKIEGVGPRYCPAWKTRSTVLRTRENHQIFLERRPDHARFYPSGISTSLPFDIRYELVKHEGSGERAYPASSYAIGIFDYFDPRSLKSSFETNKFKFCSLPGQINGDRL